MGKFNLILIIEDDQVLRENLEEFLDSSNFKTITAENGRIGVEKALQYKPDLILCDIRMPIMDGYEVLELVSSNSRTKNIPFLFISAKTDHTEIRKGMNLGADDYITKPFNDIELINAINIRLKKVEAIKKHFSNDVIKSNNKNISISSIDEFKNLLRSRGEKFRQKKRRIIYNENENAKFVYLLEQGFIKAVKMDEEGKELITTLYKENDLFGLTSFKSNSFYDETVVAIDPVRGYRLSRKYFQEILTSNPELMIHIAEILSENLSALKEHMLEIAYSSVLKKTSHTIIQLSENIQNNQQDGISMTRNELAHLAGISTESFIRSLSLLRKKSIIKIEGRKIIILDFDKLKKI